MTPEIEDLKRQRAEISARIYQLEQIEFRKACGVEAGEVIEWMHGKTWAKGRVVGHSSWVGSDVTLTVVRIKNDGTDGAECNVYPYMKRRRMDGSAIERSES